MAQTATFHYFPRNGQTSDDITLVECLVNDGRTADLPGWQECGFELQHLPSAVTDWEDDEEISRVHYAELSEWAAGWTGCDTALVSGHIRRNPTQAEVHDDYAPIQFVHSDFADSYRERLTRFYTSGGAEAEQALKAGGITAAQMAAAKRLVVIQTWRNVGPAKMDLPIAFCDARQIPRERLQAFNVPNYADSGDPFDTLAITEPSRDQADPWFYFPEMTPDEAVVFRTYDSARIATDQPYWTPHSAFRDAEVHLGQPSRHSIELRATCLFFE